MPDAMIEQVRRFNRVVTQRVGAFNDRFLGRPRPLGEARLLWEIGLDGCEVRLLRSRLGLDSGYLSRLLRSLASPRRSASSSPVAKGANPPTFKKSSAFIPRFAPWIGSGSLQ